MSRPCTRSRVEDTATLAAEQGAGTERAGAFERLVDREGDVERAGSVGEGGDDGAGGAEDVEHDGDAPAELVFGDVVRVEHDADRACDVGEGVCWWEVRGSHERSVAMGKNETRGACAPRVVGRLSVVAVRASRTGRVSP